MPQARTIVKRQVSIEFLDQGFHRVLFDAMPVPVFVVDEDVRILDYNEAAARLLGPKKRTVLQRRGGEVLHCVHSTESPDGCGHAPACKDCVVRNSVKAASRGKKTVRQSVKMILVAKGKTIKVNLRVSCQPFTYGRSSFILLVLEGLGD
jgi:PAS domain-containing protein